MKETQELTAERDVTEVFLNLYTEAIEVVLS